MCLHARPYRSTCVPVCLQSRGGTTITAVVWSGSVLCCVLARLPSPSPLRPLSRSVSLPDFLFAEALRVCVDRRDWRVLAFLPAFASCLDRRLSSRLRALLLLESVVHTSHSSTPAPLFTRVNTSKQRLCAASTKMLASGIGLVVIASSEVSTAWDTHSLVELPSVTSTSPLFPKLGATWHGSTTAFVTSRASPGTLVGRVNFSHDCPCNQHNRSERRAINSLNENICSWSKQHAPS